MKKYFKLTLLLIVVSVFLFSTGALAATPKGCHKPEVDIFGIGKDICTPADYIVPIFKVSLGFGLLLAFGSMTFASIKFGSARDNAKQKQDAMAMGGEALLGFIILISAVILLNTVNPLMSNLSGLNNLGGNTVQIKKP